MPFWEKFGIGKNNKEQEQTGLTSKDIEMMQPPQNPKSELIEFSSEGVADIEIPYYREEESRGIYTFPLPIIEKTLETGQEIAKIEPEEPLNTLRQIGPFLTSTSPQSHREAFNQAIDFLVPDGTPVLAAQDGEIDRVVMDNDEHGACPEFTDKMNLITIKHENGEQTQYIHLAKDSLVEGLDRGSKVKKGQQIAVTGMTGWTDRPHLHFLNFKLMEHPYPYHFKSLKPRFEKPQE